MESEELEYVSFWPRLGAWILDTLLLGLVTWPLLIMAYGWQVLDKQPFAGPFDLLVSYVFPTVATALFWTEKQATPGKMAIASRVVDARTGRSISFGKAVGRYLAYFLSILPLGLGFVWIAFDQKKRGWHDLLAGSVVIRANHRGPQPVRFPE